MTVSLFPIQVAFAAGSAESWPTQAQAPWCLGAFVAVSMAVIWLQGRKPPKSR